MVQHAGNRWNRDGFVRDAARSGRVHVREHRFLYPASRAINRTLESGYISGDSEHDNIATDGSVTFAYDAFNSLNPADTGVPNSLVGSQLAIAGITSGQGAADPGSVDLSVLARTPGFSYSSARFHRLPGNHQQPAPDNSQLAGLDLFFAPVGLDWKVTSTYVGAPAPEPSTLLEITLSAVTLLIWCAGPRVRFARENLRQCEG